MRESVRRKREATEKFPVVLQELPLFPGWNIRVFSTIANANISKLNQKDK